LQQAGKHSKVPSCCANNQWHLTPRALLAAEGCTTSHNCQQQAITHHHNAGKIALRMLLPVHDVLLLWHRSSDSSTGSATM
jgi:hypothetical protein